MYHAKKIGIFVSHIFGDFQRNLCQGIIDKASEFGYTTEIFSSTDGEDVGDYSFGETSILRIPNYDEFTGVCFVSGTYLQSSLKEKIADTLDEKCSCPVVEITQSDASFPSVILENDKAAGQLTEHMISTHHYKRICYLGCSLEEPFSTERFRHYRLVMEKHGLSVEESDFFFSDYSPASVHAALDHFLLSDRKLEAVICYNDRMALALMELLLKRGFRIPKDIAIAGFDNLEIGQNIIAPLSTVTFPIYEMGTTAMELLLDAIAGNPLPDHTIVTAEPVYRASCGCESRQISPTLYENQLTERIRILESSVFQDIKMSSVLSSVKDLDEGMELLEKFLPNISRCRECYICLYQDWDSIPSHIREIALAEKTEADRNILNMPFAYRDGKQLPECSFTKKSILPDYIYKDSRSSYVFSPLFFENREFGYIVFSYTDNKLFFSFDFLTWIVNVSRMLKHICDSKQNDLLVGRLENIYGKDDLTGLYNRQGFSLAAKPFLQKAKDTNAPILVMVFTLNGMEIINDTLGHLEGNFAIQVLGHALTHAAGRDLLLARAEVDTFYVLASGKTEEDATEIKRTVNNYLDNYNRLHTKKYYIRADGGYTLQNTETISTLQQIIDIAYQHMLNEKQSNPKEILK